VERRAAFAALVCALAVGGCGGDDQDRASTTAAEPTTTSSGNAGASGNGTTQAKAPPPITACPEGRGWESLRVRSGPAKLDAAALGTGANAVVFANESGDAACPWVQFARELASKGLTVALFTYASVGNPREIAAVAQALRSRGAKRVAAIGASVGGRAVVELAAMPHPGVDGVISLSAERQVGQYPDILPKARKVQLPSLYVSSRRDGYTLFGKETKQLHAATPAEVNEMLLVSGSGHGVDLVHDPAGRRVRPAILEFLRKLGLAGN
jgi:hypothetical protein